MRRILFLLLLIVVVQPLVVSGHPQPEPPRPIISNITPTATAIYLRGKWLGNRAGVFSKVGDSITVASYFFFPIGQGKYNLHEEYAGLQEAVDYFRATRARDANSFANTSLAANNQWATADVLDPKKANPKFCYGGESPLVCEYRAVRPQVALIMLGTNDITSTSGAVYQENLNKIVQISIDMGVIPILSTMPPRESYDQQVDEFNRIVINTAAAFSIPLLDYWSAIINLPERGLSEDKVHPSYPPGDVGLAADFSYENLQYGYTVRNLTGLQMLDAVWRNVLIPRGY